MTQVNRYKEAFKEQGNLVGLSTFAAISMATWNPIPILAGVAIEAAYLLFVPDSKWYGGRLSKRAESDMVKRRQQFRDATLPRLEPVVQDRFLKLVAIRDQINTQAKDDKRLFDESLRKLEFLLDKFLLFATKEEQFRSYLQSVWNETKGGERPIDNDIPSWPPTNSKKNKGYQQSQSSGRNKLPPSADWIPRVVGEIQQCYTNDMDKLKKTQEEEKDDSSKSVLSKRIEVLEQRYEFIGKLGDILKNLNYQMDLLEDTFGLINDQIRARSPEQVLSDIEGVVYQTESMTQLLNELTPFESSEGAPS